MTSRTRYQGAIIRDHQVLLLKQTEHASGRSYWQIPGGRIEPNETEEQCVQREMLEETGLEVQVDALLLDEPSPPGSIYQCWKTYRCSILAGEARPGSEPEAVYANAYSFTEVGWFDLQHPGTWNERLEADSFISAWFQRIQAALGYAVAPSPQDSQALPQQQSHTAALDSGGRRAFVTTDAVRAYYAAFGEREWQRLTNPDDGAVEFALTKQFLARYLPPSGRILDLGGGPGRYTIWLAEHGYQVVLADLSPELLAIARTQIAAAGIDQQVEAIVEADACDLSRWPDASFDAVLCLGPFYHLPDPVDRVRAAQELARLLRPGGIAAVAFMPRYALLRRTLALPDERQHLSNPGWRERLLQHGVFENDVPGRFTHGYGAQPAEIGPFFAQYGLQMLTLVASEGIAGGIQAEVAETIAAGSRLRDGVLDILVQTASDPSILGMTSHLLYIGQRVAVPHA